MKNYLRISITTFVLGCMINGAHGMEMSALKNVFKNHFLVGAALNETQFSADDPSNCEVALIKTQFNTISPENVMKWEVIHPAPDYYNFGPSDRYVDFGLKNGMFIVGHNLVWHNQTPSWVFKDATGQDLTRDALLKRMHDHIFTVVGRYKGKINGWDVVNEAVAENGTLRQSKWMKIIGPDYLVKAYQFAHQADPGAQLYYNDYSLENPVKRKGGIALIKMLQSNGVPLTAIGLQGHYQMVWPSPGEVSDTIEAFSKLGLRISISELDVDVLPMAAGAQGADLNQNFQLRAELNPYAQGLPPAMQEKLAWRYAELFQVFVKHPEIMRVTFWGVTDADSWLNNWPVRGRTSYPLLFGRDCRPKAAFEAVVAVARGNGQ